MHIRARTLFCLLLLVCASCTRGRDRTRIVLVATTSIEDSGLLDVLRREFERAHPELELAAIAVGTGQAIELGRRGDADVLLTHDSAAELELVAAGIATERRSVMYNDFVVAGPREDPAGARGNSAVAAFRAIASRQSAFVSRGDDSGTHRKELAVWRYLSIDPQGAPWYVEAGVGMGDALLMAGQKRAYILTDRGTFLFFRSRLNLQVICEGDPVLLNHYGVTVLKGDRHDEARVFATWLTQPETQQLIGEFGRAEFGQSLFKPATDTSASH